MNRSAPASIGAHQGTRIVLLLVVFLGTLFPMLLVFRAHDVNGVNGFPLDDAWIHLSFARTLIEHGKWALQAGAEPSAGTTSPLYTLLAAAGFLLASNENLLAYLLGWIAQAGFLGFLFAWSRRRLQSTTWAAVVTLLVAFDPRIGILAVSGMETSLFLLWVAAAFYARTAGRWTGLGFALVLAIWTRPEGLLLAAVLLLDLAVDRRLAQRWAVRLPKKSPRARGAFRLGFVEDPPAESPPEKSTDPKQHIRPAGDAGAFALAPVAPPRALAGLVTVFSLTAIVFALVNLQLGGGPLPNAFAAKTAHYADFPRGLFLARDFAAAFSANGWLLLFPVGLAMLVWEIWQIVRGRPGYVRAELTWWIGLSLAYLIALPYSGAFSRYLMPALPAFVVAAFGAVRLWTLHARGGRPLPWTSTLGSAVGALFVVSGGLQLRGAAYAFDEYQERCHYFHVRHERTAIWLSESTPEDSVVATHAIGAISFHGGRDIVDISGLTFPRIIPHLGRASYVPFVEGLLLDQGVTHLAVVQDWMEIDNVRPVFVADPVEEILEVYLWQPGRTHLVPAAVSRNNTRAFAQLRDGEVGQAITTLENSVRIDSQSSRTWFLLGLAREMGGGLLPAREAYLRTVELFPRFADAQFRIADVSAKLSEWEVAYEAIQNLLIWAPDYPGASELKTRIEHQIVTEELREKGF